LCPHSIITFEFDLLDNISAEINIQSLSFTFSSIIHLEFKRIAFSISNEVSQSKTCISLDLSQYIHKDAAIEIHILFHEFGIITHTAFIYVSLSTVIIIFSIVHCI
jgi:hypothetical protein